MDKNNKSGILEKIIESIFKKVIDTYLLPKIKSMQENDNELAYYTTKDLKNKFGLSSANQQYYRDQGYITYTQIGRKITYPREAVHEFLNEHTNKKKK